MENDEIIPQTGRSRDIAVAEIVTSYIALIEKVERKKERIYIDGYLCSTHSTSISCV